MISSWRRCLQVLAAVLLLGLAATSASQAQALPSVREDPAGPPVMTNPNFECSQGFVPQTGIDGLVPSGWTAVLLAGYPRLNSTRIEFAGSCDGSGFIERLEGQDSLVFLSHDIETPPLPGKPFDAAIYQQVAVTPGTAYSLSGWMVSLCGGSAQPNDCPAGYYMAKMLGIDPAGGTSPLASGVIWFEDVRNFTESRWANLRLAATAQGPVMTVFARIRSPFRWHGNHAFVDAYSLLRAPVAHFVGLPSQVQGTQVAIEWEGSQGPDIPAIPAGNYQLLFDVQQRQSAGAAWTAWKTGQPTGGAIYTAPASCQPLTYQFRVRARAEQPGGAGAFPNHRYPGDWTNPSSVVFLPNATCKVRAYLPVTMR